MLKPKELFMAFYFPVLILLIHAALSSFNMYRSYEWIDIPMHFAGGLAIGICFVHLFRLLEREQFIGKTNPMISLLLIISLVSLMAVIWEFAEFSLDVIYAAQSQRGLGDTMGDLFLGILGGFISS